ncbi:DUF4230 domain-containing protein [Echinicola vietnamensis]|uniref:Uncharacterized protein n=1 Tax=Echinicola vietnamensis (strain DSM 17526 / LMG 23754 / KMM 6221) TaxID=926556 RepID=L0G4D4_ECHVK|nr:DUF4230 domain-containing protein [Echinicola vietnamensis]AGA79876.1 hypothetical protein Echvi_3661 [Echinicola vietnamensis DSM 17526]
MIGLLLKNWRFIIDVLLVIGIVIVLFWWNPMKIFGGGLKLEDTANLVTDVNQIRELVTAEYYGEVITSIEEARLNPLQEEDIKSKVGLLYDDLMAALGQLEAFQAIPLSQRVDEYRNGDKVSNWRRKVKHDVSSRNILEKLDYLDLLVEIQSDPYYLPLMGYLWRTIDKKEMGEVPNDRDIEATLFFLYQNSPFRDFSARELDGFMEDYYYHLQASISRRESRKKLTMIGRGWVKAGFDFSELGPESIVYYEESGIIHLIGVAPKILDADINPWFIPEKGIPGFQILDEHGPVNFHDAKRVKQYCVEKLTVQAYQASILQNAHEQGQETLKNFFSLLTDSEIKQVIFHSSPFTTFAREAEKDELITYAEAYMLDSLLDIELQTIDSLENTVQNQSVNRGFAKENRRAVKETLFHLGQFPYQDGKRQFGMFSKRATDIAEDSIIDNREMKWLEAWKLPVSFDELEGMPVHSDSTGESSYWMTRPFGYGKAYNTMLSDFSDAGVIPAFFDTVMIAADNFDPEMFLDTVKVVDYAHIDQTTIQLVYQDNAKTAAFYQSHCYPFEPNLLELTAFITSKEIPVDSVSYVGNSSLSPVDTGFWFYDHHLNNSYAYHIRLKPEHVFAPPITALLQKQQFLYESDTAYLGFGTSISAEADSVYRHENPLSTEQIAMLNDFFAALLKVRKEEQNKNIIQKASDWFRARSASKDQKTLFVGKSGIRFQ